MSEVVCLSDSDLRQLLTLPLVMEAVRQAYMAHATSDGKVYPVVRERLNSDSVFGIKSGYLQTEQIVGLKAAGFWKANRARGFESHQATVLLMDPQTGKPLSVIEGNYITTIRTAAAGAVGAQLFSSPDSQVLAVIGSGVQGLAQAEAVLHVRPGIREIRCYNRSQPSSPLIRALEQRASVQICSSPQEAVQGADIIVTATPATEPFFEWHHLQLGAHINAMGADTAGKSEVGVSVLENAKVFVDDEVQSRSIGELQGLSHVHAHEIGRVLTGQLAGRTSPQEITVFDSTGIALQDLTTAAVALRLAKEQGAGTTLHW